MVIDLKEVIDAYRQDIQHLSEEIDFQEEVIKILLSYVQYETGIRSLENYLNSTLDDSLEGTEMFLHIMERVV